MLRYVMLSCFIWRHMGVIWNHLVVIWEVCGGFVAGFDSVDFALVFAWFLEGHLGSFGAILGLSGSSRSQLGSSEGPLGII